MSEFVTTIPGRNQYYVQYEVRVTAYNMFGVGRSSHVQYIHSADDSQYITKPWVYISGLEMILSYFKI